MKVSLIIEGGGVRVLAALAALHVLERNGYTPAAFAGTSAGGLMSAMLAYGYSTESCLHLSNRLLSKKMLDGESRVLSHHGDTETWRNQGMSSCRVISSHKALPVPPNIG